MLAGRLDFGVGVGYYPPDLEAAGIERKDRVPKFEESIEIIKAMWTQDEVSYHGKYFDFTGLAPSVNPTKNPILRSSSPARPTGPPLAPAAFPTASA